MNRFFSAIKWVKNGADFIYKVSLTLKGLVKAITIFETECVLIWKKNEIKVNNVKDEKTIIEDIIIDTDSDIIIDTSNQNSNETKRPKK